MEENQKIILIVDDIELNRAILCELFHDHYRVVEAENGREAMTLVRQYGTEIAVMLLDIVMPVMDGIEVMREMKRTGWTETIPVIMITAESNEDTALQGYTMGVSDIINKPFNPDIVRRRVENIIELYGHKYNLEKILREQLEILDRQAEKLRQTNSFVIDTLSTVVEFRNCESGAHIKRIRQITKILLEALAERYEEYRFSSDTIETISSAAAMHDIGKIAIPDSVLLKPGRLTPEEFEIMKTHTIRGCEILESLNYAQDEEYYAYCYEICRHHHERWDGSGYPDHLKGEEISIWAQVVSIADVYEALISERVYKPAYTHEEALRMICRGECGAFNPRLLKCFLEVSDVLRTAISSIDQNALPKTSAKEHETPCSAPYQKMDTLSERTLWLLELEREKYRILSEMSGEIVFDYDGRTDTMQFSEKYVEIFGGNFQIPNMTSILKSTKKVSEKDKEIIHKKLLSLTPAHSSGQMEIQIETASGEFEWFEVYINALWKTEGNAECVGYIGKLTNIHMVKMETKRLREQANADPLTGLYNRKAVEELVTASLSSGSVRTAAMIFIDIDNFKRVNDSKGHPFGDKTLRYVGLELKSLFRATDVVGRIGGDEFVVFLPNVDLGEVLERKMEAVCSVFHEAFDRSDFGCSISGSVGVACYPQDGSSYAELLSKADKALYHAKDAGKDRYSLYREEMEFDRFQSVLSEMDK